MSKEPRGRVTLQQHHRAPDRGVPYQRPRPPAVAQGASTSLVQADSSARGPRRLTFNNFTTFNAREKKLPPDANTQAALNSKFWQLQERASFYCNKCRRDNIISDTVAIDAVHHVMLCTRCFTRIIRPRLYRPSRVVPFPSLFSWLNYKPSRVLEMSDDIASRPAEAVAPSGDRTAAPTLGGGDRSTHIQNLPAIAMTTVPSVRSSATPASRDPMSVRQQGETHPCCRVWGKCLHGETCLFRRAPFDLCLLYLMGLCSGDEEKCHLLHQDVFGLPNTTDPMPTSRCVGDVDDPQSAWGRWIARRRNSSISAEWQLWQNGPVTELLNVYAPLAPDKAEEEKEEKKTGGKAAVKLNLSDITTALRGLKE